MTRNEIELLPVLVENLDDAEYSVCKVKASFVDFPRIDLYGFGKDAREAIEELHKKALLQLQFLKLK